MHGAVVWPAQKNLLPPPKIILVELTLKDFSKFFSLVAGARRINSPASIDRSLNRRRKS